jgi:Ca2+-binding RTX toxin-like protein
MSYSDALLLTTSGDNWGSLTSSGVTPLGFTFYSTVNPFPDYYYTDAPTDTVWSSNYTDVVSTGNEDFVQTAQKNLIRHDLSDTTGIDYRVSFSDVSNLTYSEQNSPSAVGQIFIANADVTAPNTFGQTDYPESANGYSTFAGDVWLDNDPAADSFGFVQKTVMQNELGVGEMGAYITLHELGHAVGLLHPIDTALNGTMYDNQKYTIMTDDPTKTDTDMDVSVYPTGLQLLDIAVLQSMYGVNWGGIRGDGGAHENTVYSKDGAFATANAHDAFIYTIWDGAGTDVIDASGYSTPAQIDLRQGHFSSIGVKGDAGDTPVAFDSGGVDHGNLTIAYFTVIENAIGTSSADIILGNAWTNVLYGAGGSDKLYGDGVTFDGDPGFHAANTIADATSTVYSYGPDAIAPSADLSGNDVLIGAAGDDILYGGLGNDVLDGGYNATDITNAVSGWDAAGEITGTNNDNGVAYSNITIADDGFDTADYSQLNAGSNQTIAGGHLHIEVTLSGGSMTVDKDVGATVVAADTLLSVEAVLGTPYNDVFTGTTGDPSAELLYTGGAGSDTYNFDLSSDAGNVFITENDPLGLNTLNLTNYSGEDVVVLVSTSMGVTNLQLDFGPYDSGTATIYGQLAIITDLQSGAGLDTVKIGSDFIYVPDLLAIGDIAAIAVSDLYSFVYSFDSSSYNGGSGGSGAGGHTLPLETLGSITGMEVSPVVGGTLVTPGFAKEIDSPFVITAASETLSGGVYSTAVTYHTYAKEIDFNAGITPDEVRLTASTNGGGADLTVHLDDFSYSFTASDFEDGATISGLAVYDTTLHAAIQAASTASLTSTGTGEYGGTYTGSSSLGVSSGSVSEDYQFQTIKFADGTTWDLTNGITETGTSGNDTLYGLETRDNTLISAGGADNLYGGDDNNTFVFGAGFGSSNVYAVPDSGTNTIHLTGIDPADIRLWTDSSGDLHIQDTTNPSDNISVHAGITGSGTDESTIGHYAQQITFGGGTTWDLSGGLTLATDNGGGTLYGTPYGDTLIGGNGADTIHGNGGDDVIVGGVGNDSIDGGTGSNTVDYSNDANAVSVDLSMGSATDGSHSDTLSNIQNVIGTAYDDTITGDSNDNVLSGGAGNDVIDGGGGVNTVDFSHDPAGVYVYLAINYVQDGYGNSDTISNIQNIIGSAFDDTLEGDSGNNVLNGGGGTNTVDYSFDPAGVTVDLSTGTATDGWSGTDTLINIQNVVGTYTGDVITGDSFNNIFYGSSGNDVIDGGGGINTVDFGNYFRGVTVDLSMGTEADGISSSTTLSNIQSVVGSAYDDAITGDSHDNVIAGGGGDNLIDGGGGVNTLDYSHEFGSVYVDLSMGTATNGESGTDTFSNIQNVIGSQYDDTIIGDSNDNVISGHGGNDYLDGGAGVNTIDYSHDPSGVTVDLFSGYDSNYGGSAMLLNFQTVIGTHYDDVISGDGSTTTISYETALSGVTVDLSAGTATGDGNDTLAFIPNVTGSSFDDSITGDSNDNILYGNGGNDYITGGAGAETFLFKGATAFTGVTTVADFNTGQGDKIDIADVLQGHYDPMTDAITDFVSLVTSSSNTLLKVDLDGTGGTYSPTTIALIHGVTGLDVATLIGDSNLVVPT